MSARTPVIGILALQGDYQKHQDMLRTLGIDSLVVRRAEDFSHIDRLIIPGGESSVMLELLCRLRLEEAFVSFIADKPVWGTCAGMVLLASRVVNGPQKTYNRIDIAVERNGYGRQFYSTVIPSELSLNGHRERLDLVFIRAPRVVDVGPGVTTLLEREAEPVLLSQGNVLVSAFHPELTGSTQLHEFFARKFLPDA